MTTVTDIVTNTDVVILTTEQQKQTEGHYTLSDLENLENDSVNRIVAQGLLRFVPYDQLGNVLAAIRDKLSTSGELIIEDVDIRQIAYQIVKRHVANPQISKILANTQSSVTLSEMISILQKVGFSIEDKKLVQSSYYIKAKCYA